ncbi:MAG: ABC transporter ATP-binding protein [Humibacillus sp.]|nr:ABC transporter ATP-binding protein [Humibacillus sp.]
MIGLPRRNRTQPTGTQHPHHTEGEDNAAALVDDPAQVSHPSVASEGPAGARVVVRGLAKRYQLTPEVTITAADGIDLDVEPGQITAVTGPSGSGKSTLLHLIGAIDRPDAGTITVDDTEVTTLTRGALARYRRGIGFVFQRYNLLPALTALDNVTAAVLPYPTDFDKKSRAAALLAQVGLAGRENSLPSRLSGGQQQRVAIARALIGRPRLILADEPTGNLDSHTGAEILALLLGLRDTEGVTIMIATHDHQIADTADTTIHITDGQITPGPVTGASAIDTAP